MRSIFIVIIFVILFQGNSYAQSKSKLYNPKADAKKDIVAAVAKADSLDKNVLIQIGGNWCPWCIKFNKFCKSDSIIDTLLINNFVVIHLNYSPENKNLDVLKTLGYPQRFGFPVIVFLDSKGNNIHIQDTALLESCDGGYDRNKVISILRNWTVKAINPIIIEK